MAKVNFKARQKARRYAVQALFQWHFADGTVDEIIEDYLAQIRDTKIDIDYFCEIVREVITHHADLDEQLRPHAERAIEAHNPVELAVLRLGAYELIHRPDVPARVILNEAIELNKTYGTQDGYRYVNGVLDKLAHQVRSNVADE